MRKTEQLEWRVNTPALLKEIANNPQCSTLGIPLQILADILAAVGARASELNDPKLNALMCRLAIYAIADPYSPDYNKELTERLMAV